MLGQKARTSSEACDERTCITQDSPRVWLSSDGEFIQLEEGYLITVLKL